ncbi:hypothetical protein BH10BAC1_BH10BAC1_11110 [soil metagenome]
MLEELNFYDRIIYVLRNFIEYGNYNKEPKKAIKVIHKYFPEKTIEECTTAFNSCLSAYQDAIVFVGENKDQYWKAEENRKNNLPPQKITAELNFVKKHKDVPEATIKHIIGWVLNWHHER